MDRADIASYSAISKMIDDNACGAVYPKSIAGMVQSGDIFTGNGCVLFWHYNGFAFIFGDVDEAFLDRVYRDFLISGDLPRRFVLFVSDQRIERFFRQKDRLVFGKRYFFEYPSEHNLVAATIPDGYSVRELDEEMFDTLQGRVTPRLFWKDPDEFSKHGKGYCVMHREEAAAWAFSAALGGDEIDIGVETSPDHRRRGLASLAVRMMIEYCLEQHKRPVWACDSGNTASYALAVGSGFQKISECTSVKPDMSRV